MVVQRRDGPRRLREIDDDDDEPNKVRNVLLSIGFAGGQAYLYLATLVTDRIASHPSGSN